MKKSFCFACLNLFAFASLNIAFSEEVAVIFNGRSVDGELSLVRTASSNALIQTLVRGVERYAVAENGVYVFKNWSNDWLIGRIDGGSPTVIPETNVPPHAVSGVPSHDGKKIAWVTKEAGMTALTILAFEGGRVETICHIQTNGLFRVPSWSPGDSKLAFYYGPPGSEARDGFSLLLLSVESGRVQLIELAGPSLPTRPSPTRTEPPRWSPNGKALLFQACFSYEKPFSGSWAIRIEDKSRIPVPWGTWSRDGEKIHSFFYIPAHGVDRGPVVVGNMFTGQETHFERIDSPMPESAVFVAVSRSGNWIAFDDNDEIKLLNTRTQKLTDFGPGRVISSITWCELKE